MDNRFIIAMLLLISAICGYMGVKQEQCQKQEYQRIEQLNKAVDKS